MNIDIHAANADEKRSICSMSAEWEAEQSVYGLVANDMEALAGYECWIAYADGQIAGYMLCAVHEAKNMSSLMPENTRYYELEELYVKPQMRSCGIGGAMFEKFEKNAREAGVGMLMLTTASKERARILDFYIDRHAMQMWSATLFKRL